MAKKPPLTSADLVRLWPFGIAEYQFHPDRKWRFDWALPETKVAVELDGRGHQHWVRWLGDLEKYNEAELMGWHVFHVTHAMVQNGQADLLITRILNEMIEVKR